MFDPELDKSEKRAGHPLMVGYHVEEGYSGCPKDVSPKTTRTETR